jgi:hypothetical protein
MHGNVIDISGRKFGRWIVVSTAFSNRRGVIMWNCQCDCGTSRIVSGNQLRRGMSRSCGCLKIEELREIMKYRNLTHGLSCTPAYRSWTSMKTRCYDRKCRQFKDWGGRGIQVCARWFKFENFLADMGKRPNGLTLHRINNDGHYMPSNCKWATWKEQASNRRKRSCA